MTTDHVDFSDTDRLDGLAARAERRVPRYPEGLSEGQQISPIGELDMHRWGVRGWLMLAWVVTRHAWRQFWAELRAHARGER